MRRMEAYKMIETILQYLSYPFVQYALIAGVLISLCAAVLGVTLVLKRFSFIGDGLSHVAFGAMAVAAVLNLTNNMVIILPVTVICAVLILRKGRNAKLRGDAVIAAVSVGALALGYMLMNVFSTSSNVAGDVCSSLFGSTAILTLSSMDLWLCVILSMAVLVFYVLFYNRIFAVTFDEDFASSTGINTEAYNIVIAIATAIVIVLAMNLAGSLLTSALIVFPALCAMRVFKSFKAVIVSAAVISVASTAIGILLSILLSTPVGATIVALDIVVFLAFMLVGRILKRA